MIHLILLSEGLTLAKKPDAVTYGSFLGPIDKGSLISRWRDQGLTRANHGMLFKPASDWDCSVEKSKYLYQV